MLALRLLSFSILSLKSTFWLLSIDLIDADEEEGDDVSDNVDVDEDDLSSSVPATC